eukprot:scaffold162165_cov34-Prasinocladus_malaysianus.AAC.2
MLKADGVNVAITQEEKLRGLHAELNSGSLTRFWRQMASGLDNIFSKSEISKMLKTLGLSPPAEGQESSDHSSDESDGDGVSAPIGDRVAKALAKLQDAQGPEALEVAASWVASTLSSVLAEWNEDSYNGKHALEATTEDQRALLTSPTFIKLLRSLKATHDSQSDQWSFQGENGSMWIQCILDSLSSAQK